ncbi:MAG: DUF4115 domain-containing protein [Kordiimonadaceae bacterium]|nr:DUF4115 domain-containing protein [Kordiimonadaceae bacterium]
MNSICTEIKSDHTLESVGTILKHARQNHKIRDLNIIAEDLCIKPYLLEALEQDNFDSFPSACYATGFLKNYSKYLGLDTKEVVNRYEAEYAGSKECVVLTFPEAEKHKVLPIKGIASIAAVCIVLLVGVLVNIDSNNGSNENTVEKANAIIPANIQSDTAKVSDKKVIENETFNVANPVSAPASADEVRLKANQDVWVRLSDKDGTVLIEKILPRGEDLIASQQQGLSLMTNNAAGLSVYVDGEAKKVLGNEGEIIENIALEQEKLLELSMLH